MGARKAERDLKAWIRDASREEILEAFQEAGFGLDCFQALSLQDLRSQAVVEFLDAAGFTETVDD